MLITMPLRAASAGVPAGVTPSSRSCSSGSGVRFQANTV
jgi:hypothetical protein